MPTCILETAVGVQMLGRLPGLAGCRSVDPIRLPMPLAEWWR